VSSIVGAKSIAILRSGQVAEKPHARVFRVKDYTVVIGGTDTIGETVCTCRAGQSGIRCSHVGAAKLLMARERADAGEVVAAATSRKRSS
jgi:acyl-[acyl carrier protein]--UDP-N-acetylglucosamine O-acyltransferase